MKPKYLFTLLRNDEDKNELNDVIKEIEECKYVKDKSVKALRLSKVHQILLRISAPILEQKKIEFENNFNYRLLQKREQHVSQLRKNIREEIV